jgi:hypothetical protein
MVLLPEVEEAVEVSPFSGSPGPTLVSGDRGVDERRGSVRIGRRYST